MNEENNNSSNLADTVDNMTRVRAASLSARGLLDTQIADILLLRLEQVLAIKTTEEFQGKYHAEAARLIDEQIARDEGWDAVEEIAITNLLETMKMVRDPKFSLVAAKTANSAIRRAKAGNSDPKVIGEGNTDGRSNVIMLTLNQNYIQNNNQINVAARPLQIPLKQSDVPSPKLVDAILAPAREAAGISDSKKVQTEFERMMEQSGVVFDKE